MKRFGFLIVVVLLCACSGSAIAQTDALGHHDVSILDKLYRGDFAHISDAHWSRIDQAAVINAFNKTGCSITGASLADVAPLLKNLFPYLEGGSDITGKTDSSNMIAAGDLGMPLNPVYHATLALIGSSSCKSPRVQRVGANLLKLLHERMVGGAPLHIDNNATTSHNATSSHNVTNPSPAASKAPVNDHPGTLFEQKLLPIDESDNFRYALFETSEENVQDQILKQFHDLNAKGQKVIQCEYKSPDGFSTYLFWYKQVGVPRADLLRMSPEHPLSGLGDQAVSACPPTLQNALSTLQKSLQ